MLHARRRFGGVRSSLLVGGLVVLAGCQITDNFREAVDDFRAQSAEKERLEEARFNAAEQMLEPTPALETEKTTVPADRTLVLTAQKLLAQLGYEPGPLDGLPGRKTRRAVERFQTDTGVAVDGAVTSDLVLALVDAGARGHVAAVAIAPDGAPRPRYSAGDTYVYSDSTSATVVRVENDIVVWESGDGERGATHWNFIRPGAASPFGRPRLRYDVDASADELWPLRARKTVSFSAKLLVARAGLAEDASSNAQVWRCGVEGTEPVSVAAGRFEAVRIACQTSDPIAGQPVERIWFYAPELGHYVRRDERLAASQPVESVELVAIRLEGIDWPPAARAGLHRALQAALESAPRGERIDWKSSAVETRVAITPTAELQEASSYCRTFVETVREPDGRQRVYPGVACREVSGEWVIPGADNPASPS